jgi:predicted nuclease with TOPRIM domain
MIQYEIYSKEEVLDNLNALSMEVEDIEENIKEIEKKKSNLREQLLKVSVKEKSISKMIDERKQQFVALMIRKSEIDFND